MREKKIRFNVLIFSRELTWLVQFIPIPCATYRTDWLSNPCILPMIDQQKLVKECLNGKREAQRQLYEQYAGSMLAVCYRYTKSVTDAEDILQEGFIKVYTHLHQYRFNGELGAWIRRIMVNTSINYLKKHSRYQSELSFTDLPMHPVFLKILNCAWKLKNWRT